MATAVSAFGAASRGLFNLNGSSAATAVPTASFYGSGLKKAYPSKSTSQRKFRVVAEVDEKKQTDKDRWKGLVTDTSDDQQDITRGKGMVDSLFQAPMGSGTHNAVMSSYDYISAGLRQYNLDNNMDGFYIAPAFMDKLVVHITKNFLTLPNIKVPLILGIWGGKGQGKSFQCELVFAKMGINPIMMSAGELESGNAGEPAKLIRQRYREAADIIRKGKMCVLFINDLDAGAGRLGGTTQYTVNNQMVNATLMNIADNPTNVQLPGMYNKEENPRVPIVVTGNDFSTLYAPLIRDGRMEKFYWAPTREDRIGVCTGIFRTDHIPEEDIVKLVDTFPGQSIDFFGALRARVYDDEVRKWISGVGVENIGKRLVNSKEGPPTFEQPKMTLDKLLEYGNMLVQEQENVKRVQLADKYLSEAALGDANDDAIKRGTFYGQAAQQVNLPVPEGCTDPSAENFDPTARSDDGSCLYSYQELNQATRGFKDSELLGAGKASTKSDVFAFGALLLEVVCGRRPIKTKAAPRELVLVDWVWDMWQEGDVFGVVDPNLKGAFDEIEVSMVLKLGLMCSNEVPMVRPSTRQVVRYLEGEAPLPDNLRPPWEVKSGWRMGGSSKSGEGFDGYENLLLSSSTFEKGSDNSFKRGDIEASFGSISHPNFFGALRARVYDDEVRKWISGVGVENIGKKLVNSKEGPPTFKQPKMTLDKLLEYGNMLVQEQENVKRVQLADKYLSEAALGDANDDAIKRGTFYGQAAQQVNLPVPEGCTDPSAENFDPTARSDDGSCLNHDGVGVTHMLYWHNLLWLEISTDNHIGIDINSLKSKESVPAAYYTKDLKKQDLNLKGGKPILVWIDYDSISTQINVTISPSNSKPELPIISYKYDLSLLLYESMFVGFSASTGRMSTSSHYLLGWSFKTNGTAESLSLNSLPSLPKTNGTAESPLSLNSLPSLPGPKKKLTVLIISVSVSIFVLLILSGLYLVWKIKNREVIEDWELGIGPHRYSYQELNQATRGFKDSELLGAGKASTKSDVFAFGTLLLEVVCGRRPIKPKAAPRELVLVDWVWDMWQEGDVFGVVDPNLKGAFDEIEVSMVLKLGLMCSNEVPMVRPSMRQVVRYLDGEAPLPDDLRPPGEVKSGWRMGGSSKSGEGFDGYENLLLSSSTFEKGSDNSFKRGDIEASFGSISHPSTGDAR
ncbi:hypothetical protein Vadar_032438 [Vaccinium darrowii]|uniref:Uncharacterized protein n=1 Tax=Vaccinium darrowii TaxID=229202 RepID=A0ACB7ZPD2_9ERIC|nr:hypothetical protein Vadar_032438 [Vaccinium darrowii]